MREIPRAPSRSTIAQIGQLSRRAERAIQFVHGSRFSRSIAGINDIPYLPNRLLKHELMSPYTLNQYKPLNQFDANLCGIDLIEYEVVELLEYNGFRKTLYHYQDAVSAFKNGIFAASNSQIRTAFESFVIELCCRVANTKKDGAISAIDHLENKSFLSRDCALFLRRFWAISHTNGAHPGYAHLNQTKGRLFMITGIIFDFIDLLG